MLPSTVLTRSLPVSGRGRCAGRGRVSASAAAPETAFDRAEGERLKTTDAFAELVRLNGKQSVNRPQKVRWSPQHASAARRLFRKTSAVCSRRITLPPSHAPLTTCSCLHTSIVEVNASIPPRLREG